jgi:hypothetical protein
MVGEQKAWLRLARRFVLIVVSKSPLAVKVRPAVSLARFNLPKQF